MPARIESSGEIVRIILSGTFDFSTQGNLAAAMDQALQVDAKEIQVDMTEATFIDSSVIRALLRLQESARLMNRSFSIWNCSEHVREIFVIGGFDQVFAMH